MIRPNACPPIRVINFRLPSLTPSVASLQTLIFEILRSVSRRRAALPKPHLGDGAGGAGSRGALGARN